MTMVLYQYQSLIIKHDIEKKLLCLNWEDDVIEEVYADVMKMLYQYTRELDVELWIIDASGAFNFQSLATYGLPLFLDTKLKPELLAKVLKRTKLKKIARVVSQDIAFEAKINTFIMQRQLPVRCAFFATEASAVEWLYREEEEKQTA